MHDDRSNTHSNLLLLCTPSFSSFLNPPYIIILSPLTKSDACSINLPTIMTTAGSPHAPKKEDKKVFPEFYLHSVAGVYKEPCSLFTTSTHNSIHFYRITCRFSFIYLISLIMDQYHHHSKDTSNHHQEHTPLLGSDVNNVQPYTRLETFSWLFKNGLAISGTFILHQLLELTNIAVIGHIVCIFLS